MPLERSRPDRGASDTAATATPIDHGCRPAIGLSIDQPRALVPASAARIQRSAVVTQLCHPFPTELLRMESRMKLSESGIELRSHG
ncbi:hypothetical protein BN903_147 [Halorubrum sp. AJ67]|nr:hypothetical protein BN903_147 [Halorubrum sp. AJ67]